MKVWIAYPTLDGQGSPMLTQNRQFQWYHVPSYIYPVVSAYAATLLDRDGFEVTWADAITQQWTYERFLELFETEQPDMVAIETKTPVVRQHWHIIDDLKRIHPQSKIILIGDHVTAFPAESLNQSQVDYVITGGHYDVTLLDVARHLRSGEALPPGVWYRDGEATKNTGPFIEQIDLNSLPIIDRVLTKAHLYGEKWKKRTPFFYTMAGRDCPWAKCTFCSWTTLHPRFSVRKPEHLLDEIGFLIEHHGVREIFDDTGTFPAGKWLDRFCEGMIQRGYNKEILFSINMRYGMLQPHHPELMKRAGFRKLKMGLESANQETLDRVDKGVTVQQIVEGSKLISRAGLDIQLTVMVGYPWETRKDAERTISLANDLMSNGHAEMLQATVVVPYPGTPLFDEAIENGWFRIDPTDYARFDMTETVFNLPDMTPEEVNEMCAGVYRAFLKPKYILRQLARMRSPQDLDYVWRGAIAVTGHLKDFLKERQAERSTPS
jgi:anaerobic magnesium-protoporphyrin IX monomethyl ester cyclase